MKNYGWELRKFKKMPFLNFGDFGRLTKPTKEAPSKKPAAKDVKKDPSLYGGKDYLKGETGRNWLRTDEAWKIMKKSAGERVSFEKELLRGGQGISRQKMEEDYKKITQFPNQYKKEHGVDEKERNIRVETYKKFLGK
ncbi:MAG: hypothetical protein V1705_00600 [bacterium]